MPDYLKVVVLYYGPCYKGRGQDVLGEKFLLNRVDMLMMVVSSSGVICYLLVSLVSSFNKL